jgi:hypothetical protein
VQSNLPILGASFNETPLTVRHIFEDNHNWDVFRLKQSANLRDIEIKEVNKMLSCKDESRSFFTYECESCRTTITIHFGCNSRICTNCGKNHTDKWAKSLKKKLFKVPHRHAVFTIPDVLWPIVSQNRSLHKVLMDAAIKAINDVISYRHRNGNLTAGAIVVLHPFSKNMSFNPHLHVLVTEGGFDKRGNFIRKKYISYNALRKTWQYHVLTQFKAELSGNKEFSKLVNQLFKTYRNGFYVHAPEESRITSSQRMGRYVARYIRHPAIANTRLYGYNGETVAFWYKDHNGDKYYETMDVFDFIEALIQHIPDPNFKMIRYYGAYGRRVKGKFSGYLQRSLSQSTLYDFNSIKNRWAPICPNCGEKMTFLWYEKGPPRENEFFGSKLTDWSHPLLSPSCS